MRVWATITLNILTYLSSNPVRHYFPIVAASPPREHPPHSIHALTPVPGCRCHMHILLMLLSLQQCMRAHHTPLLRPLPLTAHTEFWAKS